MEKKYTYFETLDKTLKDDLRIFLKESGIYYELSGCFDGWCFAIKCNTDEERRINNFLDDYYENMEEVMSYV